MVFLSANMNTEAFFFYINLYSSKDDWRSLPAHFMSYGEIGEGGGLQMPSRHSRTFLFTVPAVRQHLWGTPHPDPLSKASGSNSVRDFVDKKPAGAFNNTFPGEMKLGKKYIACCSWLCILVLMLEGIKFWPPDGGQI